MSVTKTEVRYFFEVTEKPLINSGSWVGKGEIEYVDATLVFYFDLHRDGRTGHWEFEEGGDPAVNERVKADLTRILSECYTFAINEAASRFAADLFDSGSGLIDA